MAGQKQSAHWFFGSKGGLDFTSGKPVEKAGNLETLEGSASISDVRGNLLFYTDGTTVYNAKHQIMLNGIGLLGNTSSTQSAIIAPDPSNFKRFYIFTVDVPYVDPDDVNDTISGINYSLVDMTLDDGLGGVVSSQKNIPLLEYASEKIAATSHYSENAIWIIAFSNEKRALQDSKFNTFYAFKVDETGVSKEPVKSVLNIYPNSYYIDYRGYLKFSPNGSKIVCNSQLSGSFVADFNKETGKVSNPLTLEMEDDVLLEEVYGAEFSPSGQYLYIDTFYDTDDSFFDQNEVLGNNRKLYQFNLNSPDINNSRKLIDKSEHFRGALQLALDGKIYRVLSKGYLYQSSQTLGAINNPNNEASTVNYNPEAIVLEKGYVTQGLPPFIQSFFLAQIEVEDHCFGKPTQFEIFLNDDFKSVVWDFGDPTTTNDTSSELAPTYTYKAPGTYKVTAEITLLDNSKEIYEKTFTIHENPKITLETAYNHYFLYQEFDLKVKTLTVQDNFTYEWKGPHGFTSTDSIPKVEINEIVQHSNYSVTVANEFGCVGEAEKAIIVHEDVESELGEDQKYCDGQSYIIGYPEKKGFTYLWNDGLTTHERKVEKSGIYTLTVTTPDGNKNTGSISVTIMPPIELVIQSKFSHYFYGDTIKLSFQTNLTENEYYQWDGPNHFNSNSKSVEVFVEGKQNQGIYSLFLKEKIVGCNKTVTKPIKTFIDVETALGKDTHLCYNETTTYSYPIEEGFSYSWNDGITSNERTFSKPGIYTLTVTTPDGNKNTGSVNISKTDLAIEKVETCYNQLFVIPKNGMKPYEYSLNGFDYQNNPLFTNIPQGFHKIYVKDAKGCIVKTEGDYFTEFQLYQAFSPNGDHINDFWDLSSLNGCRNIDVKIFDRYGKFLHRMNANQLIWDGRARGKPLPSNSYWFVIEFNDGQSPTLKGHVTIKRSRD
ncbi:MAG: T9SS type B sorting domain-containing protein [Flavobacteriales bacterium]